MYLSVTEGDPVTDSAKRTNAVALWLSVAVLAGSVAGCVSNQDPVTAPLGSSAAVKTNKVHNVGQVRISLTDDFTIRSSGKENYGWPWAASLGDDKTPSTLIVINPDYSSRTNPTDVLEDIQSVIATKAKDYATKKAQKISVAGSATSLLQDFTYTGADGTKYAGSYLASCAAVKTGDGAASCFVVRITGKVPLEQSIRDATLKSVTWVPKGTS